MTSTQVQGAVALSAGVHRRLRGQSRALAAVFTLTAFLGAALLFVVQPMVARLVLPSYGGSATVWSTSSLFFQVLLLLGYQYAHVTTRHLGPRLQPWLHVVVLLAPLATLPVMLPSDAAPTESSPVLWLLRSLAIMIGLPFLVVSTTGPLLQRWYSWSGGYRAEDPYFLFAASNLGSFGGLLLYPFLVEPLLTLNQQATLWAWGYFAFAVLTALCALMTFGSARRGAPASASPERLGIRGLGGNRIARWTLLAFIPSAMMLAVTAHVSTDIAAIPLLWVVPLAIYLATFVAAFARTSRTVPKWASRAAVGFALVAAALLPASTSVPTVLLIVIQMTMLALTGFACHAQLAAERPTVEFLTSFYLVVALGGALGGVLNGFVAPLVFDRVWEYILLLLVVPVALIPRGRGSGVLARYASGNWVRVVLSVGGGALVLVLAPVALASSWAGAFVSALFVAVLSGTAWLLAGRRLLALVPLAAMLGIVALGSNAGAIEHRRTFFGSYRVAQDELQRTLTHGTTLHGAQWLGGRAMEPTTYYSRSGPLGAVFEQQGIKDVGVIGLGVGTVAAYGSPGQSFTFIEIDPEVVAIARDPKLFTYLRDTKARVDVRVGDGRLEIAELPPASLDLLIVDAFSSDSIPVHLLTAEAMKTYADKVRPGGLIAVHTSNRVFDLRPVVRGAADRLGWTGVVGRGGDGSITAEWIVLAASPRSLDPFRNTTGWQPLTSDPVVWTDDYSSILSVLR